LELPLLVQDQLDAGEVHALFLRQPLDLAQRQDVPHRVAPAPALAAAWGDQAEPVVGAERLRVHVSELGGYGDDINGQVVRQLVGVTHVVSSSQASFARSRSSSRGSWPAVASRRSSMALRALPFRSCGTITLTVTSRLPVVPSLRRTPLPGTLNVRPFGVPAGIRTVTGAPRCDGTLTSAPSASSANVTGTVTVRSEPDRPNTGCGLTCTRTYRSPFGPPRSPEAPLPASLTRWPSATPAWMRAWMVRELIAWPLPEHVGQGSSTTMPRPRHSWHGSVIPNVPWFLLS